jgi:hypothetical protein
MDKHSKKYNISQIYLPIQSITGNIIQGDLGGKVSILGGENVEHCKKKKKKIV